MNDSALTRLRTNSWLPEAVLSGVVVAIAACTAWFDLPLVAWGPVLITALGVIYTRMSSREQVRVAERKLFIDLMQRRIDWHNNLTDAVSKRNAESSLMVERILRNEPMGDPIQLWRIHDCQREAVWLFAPPVAQLVGQIMKASSEVDDTRLTARQGDRVAALSLGERAHVVIELMTQISTAIRPYIYVGDIKARPPAG